MLLCKLLCMMCLLLKCPLKHFVLCLPLFWNIVEQSWLNVCIYIYIYIYICLWCAFSAYIVLECCPTTVRDIKPRRTANYVTIAMFKQITLDNVAKLSGHFPVRCLSWKKKVYKAQTPQTTWHTETSSRLCT